MRFSMQDWDERSLRFDDRHDAGRQLAERLQSLALDHPIVIALPRGGVEVGYEVARALDAPLDVWVVRKVGVPWQPELGVGAIAEGGSLYLARDTLAALGLTEADLAETLERERLEVERRVALFRGDGARPSLSGRDVLLVDDGIATGGTVRAAVAAIRAQGPSRIVLAVPVAAAETLEELAPEVDEVVSLLAPTALQAIGLWYRDFTQVSSDEVVRLLQRRREERARSERRPRGKSSPA